MVRSTSMILPLVCVPFSLGSICDTEFLLKKTHRVSNVKMCVIVKTRCFISFTIYSKSKLKKISTLILETFTKRHLLRNLTRFHSGLFELEILEIFTIAFSLKTITWTWIFFQEPQSALLRNEKNLKKDESHLSQQ